MEENLQVGPYLVDAFLARNLKHTHQHAEHPRRHTRQIGYVLVKTLVCNAVALQLEVGQQSRLLLGHTYKIDKRVDVLYKDSAKVAHERVVEIVVGRVRAAKYKTLSVEHTALRVVLQIHSHHVGSSLVVYALKSLVRYGYKLALVVGCARRLGIPFHGAWP